MVIAAQIFKVSLHLLPARDLIRSQHNIFHDRDEPSELLRNPVILCTRSVPVNLTLLSRPDLQRSFMNPQGVRPVLVTPQPHARGLVPVMIEHLSVSMPLAIKKLALIYISGAGVLMSVTKGLAFAESSYRDVLFRIAGSLTLRPLAFVAPAVTDDDSISRLLGRKDTRKG